MRFCSSPQSQAAAACSRDLGLEPRNGDGYQPRSGERMQPTPQGVGEKVKRSQPQRGERRVLRTTSKPRCFQNAATAKFPPNFFYPLK
jgi:hypothetical protein